MNPLFLKFEVESVRVNSKGVNVRFRPKADIAEANNLVSLGCPFSKERACDAVAQQRSTRGRRAPPVALTLEHLAIKDTAHLTTHLVAIAARGRSGMIVLAHALV